MVVSHRGSDQPAAVVFDAGAGSMFLTSTVPAAVPSDLHNSSPSTPSLAANSRTLPRTSRWRGNAPDVPTQMSFTSTVPAAVPSDFQSSHPEPAGYVHALKNSW